MEAWIAFVLGLSTGALSVCAFMAWGLLRTVDANTAEAASMKARMRLLAAEVHGTAVTNTVRVPFVLANSQN